MSRLGYNLNYAWRVLATGWCFLSFSLGGLLMTLTVFPWIRLTSRDPELRLARTQRAIHRSFRFFIGQMCALGIMRVSLENAEALAEAEGCLVLANHPTLIDVVLMISLMPRADCVVKEALWRNPWLGGVVRAAGYLPNGAPERLVQDCAQAVRGCRPLIIFPEGTRTTPGQALKFQRGPAHIALAAGRPLLPVLIDCQPSTLTKDRRWYEIPPRRFHLRLKVLEPLALETLVDASEPVSLASRHLTSALEQFFSHALSDFNHESEAYVHA
ncbi:MAG: 1-acyl-sn-glycerol-3-phosphate acyltransferase [Gammaproteobacteria bacterium]|nr:1-acyl-sn-glycerol-3-phosphate acyltransferase [Gammaproteobacteria bacterium]